MEPVERHQDLIESLFQVSTVVMLIDMLASCPIYQGSVIMYIKTPCVGDVHQWHANKRLGAHLLQHCRRMRRRQLSHSYGDTRSLQSLI